MNTICECAGALTHHGGLVQLLDPTLCHTRTDPLCWHAQAVVSSAAGVLFLKAKH